MFLLKLIRIKLNRIFFLYTEFSGKYDINITKGIICLQIFKDIIFITLQSFKLLFRISAQIKTYYIHYLYMTFYSPWWNYLYMEIIFLINTYDRKFTHKLVLKYIHNIYCYIVICTPCEIGYYSFYDLNNNFIL